MRKPVYLLLAAVLLAELDAASACSMRNLANDEDLFCQGINRVVRTSISSRLNRRELSISQLEQKPEQHDRENASVVCRAVFRRIDQRN